MVGVDNFTTTINIDRVFMDSVDILNKNFKMTFLINYSNYYIEYLDMNSCANQDKILL